MKQPDQQLIHQIPVFAKMRLLYSFLVFAMEWGFEDLSPEHRKAITLVFFEGLPLRQAGERMGGKSEDAVRMMLRRAEAKLGDRLNRTLGRDLDPSEGAGASSSEEDE